MIHLPNASLSLTTVVRSVRFPVQAGSAPRGATICLTDKGIPAVEILQARRWFCSRRRRRNLACITVARDAAIFRAFSSSILQCTFIRASAGSFSVALFAQSLRFCFVLSQCTPVFATWNVTRIHGNGKEEAGIGEDEEEEKDRIYHKDANCWARARRVESGGRSEEVIHC